MNTVLLDTDDLGMAEQVLGQTYAAVRISGAARETTRLHISRRSLGALTLDDARVGFDVNYDTASPEKIWLCRIRSGMLEEHLPARDPKCVGAGDILAMGALGVPFSGRVSGARCDIVAIDRGLLDRVAAAADDKRRTGPVRLTDSRPVSAAAGRRLVRAVDYLSDGLLAEPAPSDPTLIVSTVMQHLAASMLAAFPNSALLDPTAEDRHDTTPVLLRRAIAFIEEHADSDIGLSDIAHATYVTPRAIQLMFRRHRNCTPMEYLRRVRLHHAHHDLLRANRAQTTVTQVASRWGFAHTGRFAVYYRQVYGQSPHTTLRD
jgi:AraC-like DNA-binding protein